MTTTSKVFPVSWCGAARLVGMGRILILCWRGRAIAIAPATLFLPRMTWLG